MHTSRPRLRTVVPLLGLLTAFAATLNAQQQDQDSTTAKLPTVMVRGARQQSLSYVPTLGKTGTRLEDLPASVQIIPREITEERDQTSLREAIRDVSGVSEGGPSSYGFFDRFLMRGLDLRIASDGFSDGDQINGLPHSLNGIDHIEVLKGPGSALLGSGPAGGTINIVHLKPQPVQGYGITARGGSFGAYSTDFYATGPTGQRGLDYRVDGFAERTSGFRNLESQDLEVRPDFTWALRTHLLELSVDARHIEQTPDAYGLIYLEGEPIDMSRDTKYSTPFSTGDQDLARASLSDVWAAGSHLTIHNRLSFLHRNLHLQRNSGSDVSGNSDVRRQFRRQHDVDDDVDYQFEPLWNFSTGSVGHSLLTGVELQYQHIRTMRATADVPDIADIFAPVIPEQSVAGLDFQCDEHHSCDNDRLSATYVSAYVTDQVDLTNQWKLRLGARQDWWNTALTPTVSVPGRVQENGQPFQPGVTVSRTDAPVSWNVGTLYRIARGVSPFIGVSRSHLANFNSEATQKGTEPPESALQYETGVKLEPFGDRLSMTASLFQVKREHVFAEVHDTVFFNNQETRGGELDMSLRATSRWNIAANLTAQHSELTDNPSQPAVQGNQPVAVPSRIFNLWSTYDFRIGALDGFRIGGGVSYRDKIYGDTQNTEVIPSFTVIDGVVGFYRPAWDVALNVDNLTDVTYFTTALGAGARVGDPRSFFIKASVRY